MRDFFNRWVWGFGIQYIVYIKNKLESESYVCDKSYHNSNMEVGMAKNSHYTITQHFCIPRQKRMNKQLKKNMKWKKVKNTYQRQCEYEPRK